MQKESDLDPRMFRRTDMDPDACPVGNIHQYILVQTLAPRGDRSGHLKIVPLYYACRHGRDGTLVDLISGQRLDTEL